MKFKIIKRDQPISQKTKNTGYLRIDHWNDFSFVTMFYLYVNDENGDLNEIGRVKIGFRGQTQDISTYSTLGEGFSFLPAGYFSLGESMEYYENINKLLSIELKQQVLHSLHDIVFDPNFLEKSKDEDVLKTSLLRDVSLSVIKGQYTRVLDGLPPLTDFKFLFDRPDQEKISGIKLVFNVKANSTPSTNIHAVIGRNGVGKTTLLNDMIKTVVNEDEAVSKFYEISRFGKHYPIDNEFFSGLVSVSFSAFDPFHPPKEQPDPSKGACYFYIGLKDLNDQKRLRPIEELQKECVAALCDCFRIAQKKNQWDAAIKKLCSDQNFESMELHKLYTKYVQLKKEVPNQSDSDGFRIKYFQKIKQYLSRMSSGHAVVFLTITRLVATVEEKTLVLLDEPESHLHPPLLSAFLRALSDLLYDRNGVAIIATHSPVVLQEIPKSCVWKIDRVRTVCTADRLENETFGENVGVLTREVFGLEVDQSGFHDILKKAVLKGDSYEKILQNFNSEIGFEGRALLRALIKNASENHNNDTDE